MSWLSACMVDYKNLPFKPNTFPLDNLKEFIDNYLNTCVQMFPKKIIYLYDRNGIPLHKYAKTKD